MASLLSSAVRQASFTDSIDRTSLRLRQNAHAEPRRRGADPWKNQPVAIVSATYPWAPCRLTVRHLRRQRRWEMRTWRHDHRLRSSVTFLLSAVVCDVLRPVIAPGTAGDDLFAAEKI